MPKVKAAIPVEVPYTDERLGIPRDMVDEDNMNYGVEAQFDAGASMEEGVSGRKPIDTSFENTSEDTIDAPRSGERAPVQVNAGDYPHRRY